jgi:23S rRNA pseudouridine1911/1915/1917 synthase
MSDSEVRRFEVPDDAVGRRLDVVVAEVMQWTRSRAAARIEAGDVLVDGRVAPKAASLGRGAMIEVVARGAASPGVEPPPLPPVRYRDEHLLVVAKPAGLVVHPGAGHVGDTLVDACRAAGITLAPGPEAD